MAFDPDRKSKRPDTKSGVPLPIVDDGGVFGDPSLPRFATGRAGIDVRDVGEEMARNRHRGSDAFRDAED